jgi:hypothetical protein
MKKLPMVLCSIVTLLCVGVLVFLVVDHLGAPEVGEPRAQMSGITEARAREIAQDDAKKAYGDLSAYDVRVVLEKDGWHVDFELKEKSSQGGGPHYIIDPQDGKIIKKQYDQ